MTMTVREINEATRTGKYVYLVRSGVPMRVTRSRTERGIRQVRALATAEWHAVVPGDVFEIR